MLQLQLKELCSTGQVLRPSYCKATVEQHSSCWHAVRAEIMAASKQEEPAQNEAIILSPSKEWRPKGACHIGESTLNSAGPGVGAHMRQVMEGIPEG